MWGRLPTFFCLWASPRLDVKDALEDVVASELDAVGYDLVELRRGGTKSRPLIEIRIDRRDGQAVSVDDCATVSRALEARLDGSEHQRDARRLQDAGEIQAVRLNLIRVHSEPAISLDYDGVLGLVGRVLQHHHLVGECVPVWPQVKPI